MKSSRRDPVRRPAAPASCYALQLDRRPAISDNARVSGRPAKTCLYGWIY